PAGRTSPGAQSSASWRRGCAPASQRWSRDGPAPPTRHPHPSSSRPRAWRPPAEDEARYDEAFEEHADLGCAADRELVWDEPRFETFCRAATPIEEIGEFPIGSRPAKRAAGGIEALRAIPWVFAWT